MNGFLVCHPATSSGAVRSIAVTMERSLAGIAARYVLAGDLHGVRIPEPRTPQFVDELWRHTCFELFARAQSSEAYVELNFSPSGEWAAYAFDRYREGMRRIEGVPSIATRREGDTLVLDVSVPRGMIASGALAVGLSAVIEDADGGISYWALNHRPGKPDFHYRDAFAFRLE